jgi:two-component system sensor histidine kinase KdpD
VSQNGINGGVNRRVVRRTRGFFDGKSTTLVAGLGFTFIAAVSVIDYLIKLDLSLALFYLMPIALVTWNLGRRWGGVAVVLSTVASFVADAASVSNHSVVPYWSSLVRLAAFLAIAMLAATLRAIIDAQWERVEHESEVSSDLREMNDVKDTLLHAVSHDLKNPLAGILGAMQTIRRDDELHLSEAERESLYEVIEQSGRKMNRLIDDLIDLDRIDRGKLQPNRKPTDLGELTRRVARECPDMETHPVRVESDEIHVDLDAAKVERIIENLLVNASRHTPPGTSVQVRVQGRSNGAVLIVEDEGPGIPDELKAVLFEPFRQGDTSSGRGMGIGLSLVQRFAQLHGGSAYIEDREGGGARFVVTLPGTVYESSGDAEGTPADALRLRAV